MILALHLYGITIIGELLQKYGTGRWKAPEGGVISEGTHSACVRPGTFINTISNAVNYNEYLPKYSLNLNMCISLTQPLMK